MRVKRPRTALTLPFIAIATLIISAFAFSTPATAQTETVLFNFPFGGNAFDPDGPLVLDKAGNLYGTAEFGGPSNEGAVYQLKPKTGGGWSEKAIHTFSNGNTYPFGGVVFDSAGNLYGVTLYGGAFQEGIVFKLTPQSNGTWAEKNLHVFGNGKDGQIPAGPLTIDSAGNLFGTTDQGGAYAGGVVYQLIPNGKGSFNEKILHNFGRGPDGSRPLPGLIFDSAGNIYGATAFGGTDAAGTVYKLQRNSNGTWSETIIHNFSNNGVDGNGPQGPVVLDSAGNLYGTTQVGGLNDWGTVYELSPQIGGTWNEIILHNFNLDGVDGVEPFGALIFDKTGNLYGATFDGGAFLNGPNFYHGTAYELSSTAGGWSETILHSFGGGTDGGAPNSGMIFDASGNLFGSTLGGGTSGEGTAYEIAP